MLEESNSIFTSYVCFVSDFGIFRLPSSRKYLVPFDEVQYKCAYCHQHEKLW